MVILLIAINTAYPNDNVTFTRPTDGQTITTTYNGSSESTVYVRCDVDFSTNAAISKVIVYANGNVYDSYYTGTNSYDFYLAPGTYTFKAELYVVVELGAWALSATKSITFNVKHTIYAVNNFGSGNINLESTTKASGSSAYKFTGDALSIGAIDQSDAAGYNRVWNAGGTNISNWQRKSMTANSSANILGATARNYSYAVVSNDNGANIIADLKRSYTISRNDQTEFDGTISDGVVSNIVDQNTGAISAPARSLNGKNYIFYQWTDGDISNPKTITPTDNTILTANYKASLLTSSSTALDNRGHQQAVRTLDGAIHLVYCSSGAIWYEKSTDNGTTWLIRKIADNAITPSIDYDYFNNVYIVYQQVSNGSSNIFITYYAPDGTTCSSQVGDEVLSVSDPTKYSPLVAAGMGSDFMVIYRGQGSLDSYERWYYSYGGLEVNSSCIGFYSENTIPGTDTLSRNFTATARKDGGGQGTQRFIHIAWQQDSASTNSIRYTKFLRQNGTDTFTSTLNVSAGDGYSKNTNPSISVGGQINSGAVYDHIFLAWTYNNGTSSKVLLKIALDQHGWAGPLSYSTYTGSNMQDDAIPYGVSVKANPDSSFAIGWLESYLGSPTYSRYIKGNLSNWPSSIYQLALNSVPILGAKSIQILDGTNLLNTYGIALKNSTSPYAFTKSDPLQTTSKVSSVQSSMFGRRAVISKGGAEFYADINNILLKNNPVKFVNSNGAIIIDTVLAGTKDKLNNSMQSEPFLIDQNSDLYFDVDYGPADSSRALKAFNNDGEYINYKVQLVDNTTGEVLGTFNDITYNMKNSLCTGQATYRLNTESIGSRTVKLILKSEDNVDAKYSLVNNIEMEDSSISMHKKNSQEVSIDKLNKITTYGLSQNYPNPFNPTTVINYQIPKDGVVTVKVYDVLGNEVATLVNGYKTTGQYSVSFDGSKLSSGVYFYQLRVNGVASANYVKTKKMMLLK